MECVKEFADFYNEICLESDSLRKDRIFKAQKDLNEFLSSEFKKNPEQFGIKDIYIETFVQGSVALNTCIIPPTSDDEFDLDEVISLRLRQNDGKYPSAKDIIKWLSELIKKNDVFSQNIETKTRCIRIVYKKDFHMDIAPMTPVSDPNGILLIPDKQKGDEGIWNKTHPKGYIEWFRMRNQMYNDKIQRTVKFLKWWRTLIVPGIAADVSSVVLTTLVANYFVDRPTDSFMLVETMENLNDYLSEWTSVPKITNPTLDSENYADRWESKNFEAFKRHLNKATQTARSAYDAQEYNTSIRLWREIFGPKFAKSIKIEIDREPDEKRSLPRSNPPSRRSVNREFG